MKRFFALLLTATVLMAAGCQAQQQSQPQDRQTAQPQQTAAQQQPAQATVFAMDTVMELKIYGDSQLLNRAQQDLLQLEQLLSVTDEQSEIAQLNRQGQMQLSQHTAQLLTGGLDLCQRTQGALDLSLYPVTRAWGFTTGQYAVPEQQQIDRLLESVDYRQIALDRETGWVTLPEGMEIDLGSVAKGYAGDQLAQLFRQGGVESALLNLGGNVQAVGAKPDGSPWRVAVQDPWGQGTIGVLEIVDQAVITSGGYERYFEQDGQVYWHIMDRATGGPARSGLASVTIVGKEGLTCDGLSTALFVMGLDKAADFWRESQDFEAIFVDSQGNLTITQGLEDKFTPTGSYAQQPIAVIRHD